MEDLHLEAEQLREKNWLLQDQLDDTKRRRDSRQQSSRQSTTEE